MMFGELLQDAEQMASAARSAESTYLPPPPPGGSSSSDFGTRIRQSTTAMAVNRQTPAVDRTAADCLMGQSLQQVVADGERLWAKSAAPGGESKHRTNTRAAVLLGSRGFDISKLTGSLDLLSDSKPLPLTTEDGKNYNVDGYVNNLRETNMASILNRTAEDVTSAVEDSFWKKLENDWTNEKQNLMALFENSNGPLQLPSGSRNLTEADMQTRSGLSDMELSYARQVFKYNEDVLHGSRLPRFQDLMAAVDLPAGEIMQVKVLWRLVCGLLTATDDVEATVSGPVGAANMRSSATLQAAFIEKLCTFLEDNYLAYIYQRLDYYHQPTAPERPPLLSSVCVFITTCLDVSAAVVGGGFEDGTLAADGRCPLWPAVYFCLRCGDLQSALEVLQSTSATSDPQEFGDFLSEFMANGKLSPASETRMWVAYSRNIKCSSDPYKKVCYCVLSGCDPIENHSSVCTTLDDYTWLKLRQVTTGGAHGKTSQRMELATWQKQLAIDYGESHFEAERQPFVYFQLLICSLQFETAIEFLSRFHQLRCHAVHVALALHTADLLLIPANPQSPMLSSAAAAGSDVTKNLNIARLLLLYTRGFSTTDPLQALQYFYFLKDEKTPTGENMLVSCIVDMVVQTKEYRLLLGEVERNGERKAGAIDKFFADTKAIIVCAANRAEKEGLLEEAINLYDLIDDREKVLQMLVSIVSPIVTSPDLNDFSRNQLLNLADSIKNRYDKEDLRKVDASLVRSFHLLLQLTNFFNLYHVKKFELAIQALEDTKLVATSPDDIQARVAQFARHPDTVRAMMADIFTAATKSLYTLYASCQTASDNSAKFSKPQSVVVPGLSSSSPSRSHMQDEMSSKMAGLHRKCVSLVTFAGMIPHSLPADVYSNLKFVERKMPDPDN